MVTFISDRVHTEAVWRESVFTIQEKAQVKKNCLTKFNRSLQFLVKFFRNMLQRVYIDNIEDTGAFTKIDIEFEMYILCCFAQCQVTNSQCQIPVKARLHVLHEDGKSGSS